MPQKTAGGEPWEARMNAWQRCKRCRVWVGTGDHSAITPAWDDALAVLGMLL